MAGTRLKSAVLLLGAAICSWGGAAPAGEIATVVESGDVAPGTGGEAFVSFRVPVVNGAGEVAFQANIGAGGNSGIWLAGPAGLSLVAKTGDPAPGAGGATFTSVSEPVLNGAGDVAFFGGDGGDGIWVGPPGGLAKVARTGDIAPGTGGATLSFGSSFDSAPVLNGAGQVAFRADIGSGGEAILLGSAAGLALVARTGAPAPGAGGAAFTFLDAPVVLNGAGQVAFSGELSGSGEGIWLSGPNGVSLVARDGDIAPDTGGATFGSLSARPVLNGAGEVAFAARIEGRGVTPANSGGLWLGRPGALALVVRTGDPAPGAGGATFIGPSNPILNGAGEVAFHSQLSDGRQGIWLGRPAALGLVVRSGDSAPGANGATFMFFGSPILNGAGELALIGILTGAGVSTANDSGIWAGRPGGLLLIAREGDEIEVAPGIFKTVVTGGLSLTSTPANSGNEDGRPSGFSAGGQTTFFAGFTDTSQGIFLSPPDAPSVHRAPYRAIDGAWGQITLPRSFAKPVIIAGPPGSANKAPGIVRLRKTQGAKGRFEARFQEWRYLNGKHPEERVDFLALETGRHKQADGSIWEAGTVKLKGNRIWKKKKFSRRFPGVPRVFATVQSFRDKATVAARVRKVTRSGFEVSIQEEEKDLGGRHPKETVGYLAVFSRTGRGTIAGGVEGTDYRLKRAKVRHRFKNVPGGALKLEEEKSKDKETRHKKEAVSIMTLGRGLFAQQASDKERDTTAIRRR